MAVEDTSQASSPEGEALFTPEGQQAHLAAVEAAANAAGGAEVEQPEATPEKGATRGKDGKFVAKDGKKPEGEEPEPKEAKAASRDEPAKSKEAKGEPAESPGSLAKFRRLLTDGKVDEAMALAGVDAESFEFNSKAWKEVRGVFKEERAEIRAKAAEVQQSFTNVRAAAAELIPLAQAVEAYKKGDLEAFIKHATGETLEQFQRRVIASIHGQPQADPKTASELAELRRELQAERAERQREKQAIEAARAASSKAEARAQYMGTIAEELENSGEPHLVKVATRKAFLDRTYEIQAKSYNKRTDTCLPALEAAAQAYEEIYGDPEEDATPSPKAKSGNTQRRGTEPTYPAARDRAEGGRKPKTPSHSHAAEAAPVLDEVDVPFDSVEKQQERQARILARLMNGQAH